MFAAEINAGLCGQEDLNKIKAGFVPDIRGNTKEALFSISIDLTLADALDKYFFKITPKPSEGTATFGSLFVQLFKSVQSVI